MTSEESIHALSGAYAVDALDDHEREHFEAHLPLCSDCRAEVVSLRQAVVLMADESALAPPESLRSGVLAGISRIRPLPPLSPSASTTLGPAESPTDRTVVPFRARRRRFRIAVAAAAVVVTVVGVGVVAQPWKDDTTSQLSAADRVLAASDATRVSLEFKDGASATVVRSLKQGRAVLLTQDMSAPPNGKVYELWFQDTAGDMVPAGMMVNPGDHKVLLRGDASKATGVGITVEPAGGSDKPSSEPIALFDLSSAQA